MRGVYFCPVCHKPRDGGVCCDGCYQASCIKSEIAITTYREEALIGNIIHTLKYSLAEDVLIIIERMIISFLGRNKDMFTEVECIVPVPLHKKRLAERGFNQAELIANILGRKINKPVRNFIQRTKNTPHQARLSRQERLKNVVGAFAPEQNLLSCVLLVDDIYTTGSTIQECARGLKKQGVEKVYAFTLARG
ncbi:MAG: ComF family protein [Candidatus Magasanikbacteria bacterium]